MLFEHGFYDGAKYILGYVLEAAFKARICKILDSEYPNRSDSDRIKRAFPTHDYKELLVLSGLKNELKIQQENTDFAASWSLLAESQNKWTEKLRYELIGSATKIKVKEFFEALVNIRRIR